MDGNVIFHLSRNAALAALVAAVLLVKDYHIAVADDCDSAKTTKDIVDCQDAQFKKATQALSNLQQQLSRVLTTKQRKALEKAHSAWLSYREEHCNSAAFLYEGGTMETVISVTCFAELTKERVKQLHSTFEPWLRLPKPGAK